jgi:hypothetical protein
MRHLILGISGALAFMTIASCVFREVSFTDTLWRGGIVMLASMIVGFAGVSLVVAFGYLGKQRTSGEQAQRDRSSSAAPKRGRTS